VLQGFIRRLTDETVWGGGGTRVGENSNCTATETGARAVVAPKRLKRSAALTLEPRIGQIPAHGQKSGETLSPFPPHFLLDSPTRP